MSLLDGVLPGGGVDLLREEVARIAANRQGTLSATFLFSLAASLWSANSGMKGLFEGMNVVYEVDEKRSFIRLNLQSAQLYLRGDDFCIGFARGDCSIPIRPRFPWARGKRVHGSEAGALAAPLFWSRPGPRSALPLRSQPESADLAMDHMGQRDRLCALARRIDIILLVCREFWQL
jgi:hypothetical protein